MISFFICTISGAKIQQVHEECLWIWKLGLRIKKIKGVSQACRLLIVVKIHFLLNNNYNAYKLYDTAGY